METGVRVQLREAVVRGGDLPHLSVPPPRKREDPVSHGHLLRQAGQAGRVARIKRATWSLEGGCWLHLRPLPSQQGPLLYATAAILLLLLCLLPATVLLMLYPTVGFGFGCSCSLLCELGPGKKQKVSSAAVVVVLQRRIDYLRHEPPKRLRQTAIRKAQISIGVEIFYELSMKGLLHLSYIMDLEF